MTPRVRRLRPSESPCVAPGGDETTWMGVGSGETLEVHTARREPGSKFKFISAKVDPAGEVLWITCWGGLPGREMWRSFRPEDVSPVVPKTRKSRKTNSS